MTALSLIGTESALAPGMTNRALRLISSNMTTDQDENELRDTQPPGAITSILPPPPPEGASTLEEIAHNEDPATWAGFNESKFMHRATKAVIDGTNELLKARQIWDIEAIVRRQSLLFQEALEPKFQALATRLDGDIGNLRTEFEAMKKRMTQMTDRMSQIETALKIRAEQ